MAALALAVAYVAVLAAGDQAARATVLIAAATAIPHILRKEPQQ